jgi:hypothetical protein
MQTFLPNGALILSSGVNPEARILQPPQVQMVEVFRYPIPISHATGTVVTLNFDSLLADQLAARYGLSNARLKKLAARYKPPQSWYEEDEEEGLY